ncbi:MAG: hypothetical protein GMKNLPBB_00599 [Myxococcota bacterium]|nr:hypothetical protein [Myxococcota bacterium]
MGASIFSTLLMQRRAAWTGAGRGVLPLAGPGLAGLMLLVACAAPETARAQSGGIAATPLVISSPGNGDGVVTFEKILDSADRHYPPIIGALQQQAIREGEQLAAEGGFDLKAKGKWDYNPFGFYKYGTMDLSVEQPTTLWGTRFFAGWRSGLGKFPSYKLEYETNDFGEVRGGFMTPLWRNGPIDRERADLRQAEMGVEMARYEIDEKRLAVLRLAGEKYWEFVAAAQKLLIARELLRIAEERDAGILERVKQGDLAEIEHTDNQRAILSRREKLIASGRKFQKAAIALSLYWRDGKGEPVTPSLTILPPDFPEPRLPAEDVEKLVIPEALKARPEIRRIELERDRMAVELKFADNQFAPSIDVYGEASKDMGPGSPTRDPAEFNVGLMVEAPIPFRKARGKIEVAEAKLSKLEQELRFARDGVAAEVRDAWSALTMAKARVNVARETRVVAHQLEEAERTSFNLGNSHLLIVNIREEQAAAASEQVVDAELDFYRAQTFWQAATGRMLIGRPPPVR